MERECSRCARRRWIRLVTWGAAVLAVLALLVCWSVARWRESSGPLVIVYAHEDGQQSPAKTEWGKKVAEACGCEIEWRDVTPESEEGQLIYDFDSYGHFSDWSKPDVVVALDYITDHERIEFLSGTDGYLDFRDYLKGMPNVSEYFRRVPQAKAIAQQKDGSIVSIPGDAGEDYDGSMVHMFVNRVWLDKLGLQAPTTWDELKSVLVAFRDRDPNGNGQADEIPLSIRPTGENAKGNGAAMQQTFSNDGWHLFMNSTGVVTQLNELYGANFYAVSDGRIWDYMRSDQMRQVVSFIAGLAEEGLIPRNTFEHEYALARLADDTAAGLQQGRDPNDSTVDVNVGPTFAEYEAQLAAATPVAGVAFAFDASAFGPNADQYESIPIPAAEAGAKVTWDYSARARFNLSGVSVRGDSRHLDQAIKAVDALFGEDVSLGQYYGEEGVTVSRENGHTKVAVSGEGEFSKGYGRSFVGWIRPGTVIDNDKPRERYLAAEKPYQPIWQGMDGDVIIPVAKLLGFHPGTGIDNVLDKQLAQWVYEAQSGNGFSTDNWNAFVREIGANSAYNNQERLDELQRAYDRYRGQFTSVEQ